MPAVTRKSLFATLVLTFALLQPGIAYADFKGPEGGTTVSGNSKSDDSGGGSVSATAGAVVFDYSHNGSGAKAGPVTAASDWTPPACYYAPKYTPAQLKAHLEPIWEAESTGYEWDAKQRAYYKDGDYPDFNKKKTGEGYWWDSYVTPGREGEPGALDCDKPIFWVDNGEAPPAGIPQAITPEMLARLAYAEVRVPSTKVRLAPEGASKVNLPTWAWLDAGDVAPVSVTASVPLLRIQATTTATAASLAIEPGTPDARTLPASGACPLVAGRIGEPYAAGKANRTPPCGVTYLRSSGDATFPLRATLTWKIHWTGTGVAAPQPLPDGRFGAEQDVTVREIQSVNR
ncbi:hypothetical protein [Streptomyces sp. SID11385]|uniref:hypothetical protein n=1 Tax=Streptomyces sp. SID11385 TaxID=2706031 RepID=UPI0013C9EF7F|nr:hypothetical protein [Streptomyces sp. SID11385]NEA40197.1 hypothetical protein [Streptomyces sp. SID11385]